MAFAGKDRVGAGKSGVTVELLEGRQLYSATLDPVTSTGDASSEALLAAPLNAPLADAEATERRDSVGLPEPAVPDADANSSTPPADDVLPLRTAAPNLSLSSDAVTFDEPPGGGMSPVFVLTIRNTGFEPVALPTDGLTIAGKHAALFQILHSPEFLTTPIPPGASLNLPLVFTPGTGDLLGVKAATLCIRGCDAVAIDVPLRGLVSSGNGFAN